MTVCTKQKECLFGDVVDGNMVLNDAGSMVEELYHELENKFSNVRCDSFICMPNHVHFIINIVGADLCVCPDTTNTQPANIRHNETETHDSNTTGGHAGPPLPKMIQWFKSMTTNAYIQGVRKHGWKPFNGKLWQRNYFERVIRNERELNRIREYIEKNPLRWVLDRENPEYASHRERTHWGE